MKNKSVRVILSMLLNICIVTVGVFIIYAAGSRAYTFGHNIFDEEAIDTTENARQVEITISDNISAKQLSSMLYQKGLCKDKTIMYFQIMLSDYNKKFVYNNIKNGEIRDLLRSPKLIEWKKIIFGNKNGSKEFICMHCAEMRESLCASYKLNETAKQCHSFPDNG